MKRDEADVNVPMKYDRRSGKHLCSTPSSRAGIPPLTSSNHEYSIRVLSPPRLCNRDLPKVANAESLSFSVPVQGRHRPVSWSTSLRIDLEAGALEVAFLFLIFRINGRVSGQKNKKFQPVERMTDEVSEFSFGFLPRSRVVYPRAVALIKRASGYRSSGVYGIAARAGTVKLSGMRTRWNRRLPGLSCSRQMRGNFSDVSFRSRYSARSRHTFPKRGIRASLFLENDSTSNRRRRKRTIGKTIAKPSNRFTGEASFPRLRFHRSSRWGTLTLGDRSNTAAPFFTI